MATVTETTKGFRLPCPFCTDEDAVLFINLDSVNTIRCPSCDEEFTVEQARERTARLVAQWDAFAAWLEAAPTLPSQ